MISLKEIMGDNKFEDLTPELQANALEQLRRVNLFREAYGKPMYVTSGYRTLEHNAAIGGAKNSAHCEAKATDFKDSDGELKKYIAENPDILEKCDLWAEEFEKTPTWLHLQSRPASKRIFKA